MKIIWADLHKAKNNIKNKIDPRVERGNISPFSFCKQFWNIPTPLWFSRNPPRELHGQNMFTWTTLCLQRLITEIRRGLDEHKRKLVLAKTRFVWTIRFSDQLLAGSLVEIWQLIRRQQTTNHKFLNIYDPTSKYIMPSFPASKYRKGEYDRRLVWLEQNLGV